PDGVWKIAPFAIDSLDAVNRITAAKTPDSVWPIGGSRCRRPFSSALVRLRPAAFGQKRSGAKVLRDRSAARRLERSPTRSPDRCALLRADRAFPIQGENAHQGRCGQT